MLNEQSELIRSVKQDETRLESRLLLTQHVSNNNERQIENARRILSGYLSFVVFIYNTHCLHFVGVFQLGFKDFNNKSFNKYLFKRLHNTRSILGRIREIVEILQ